ncbi:HAD-superfamily class IIA hydrolase, TIGR01459 [Faunimonas pinastri]|uniref:HAD-superfamily class IIA hydrolase, TIGR01459 n=1 Tax=Faunimonas pinastri TaxID=1855383 RepID=A0A1H8ZJY5_9HYPH|nr:TIGR01459 family HAD-type hydrolase [Faunimonas pinastri]SEP64766.1 HAD-superfamily class IIA hydrolase, TIGR01459 [Faunimonas pinastri]
MIVKQVAGLQEIAGSYDTLLCDVWGVLHNGAAAFVPAVDALMRFRGTNGPVILITNAPRPGHWIKAQIKSLGVPDEAYDVIVTSGDVTRGVIGANPGVRLFHLGAERDLPFYEGLDVVFADEADADLISCTGLFDDETETPDDYRELLTRLVARGLRMVCANPDLVVERRGKMVYCAGALARLYEELGGEVVLVGKPHAPIYEAVLTEMRLLGRAKPLAVGDGIPTDVLGATRAGIDVLFITGGIHAGDFGPEDQPEAERVSARLEAEKLSAVGFLPRLAW